MRATTLANTKLAGKGGAREKPMCKIVSIVHTPAGIDPPPDHYARVPLAVATLEAGRGIDSDRKGSRPDRQLNIMALETLERLRRGLPDCSRRDGRADRRRGH